LALAVCYRRQPLREPLDLSSAFLITAWSFCICFLHRHTYTDQNAAGWPGSRTYRRACSATQWFEPHLRGSVESLYGATYYPPIRCWPSDIPWQLATGCYEIDLKVFRRLHLSVEPYRRSRPYGSSLPSQYNASCAGRRSKCLRSDRKPLSDFTVAAGESSLLAH
jgi:hypothetical protein